MNTTKITVQTSVHASLETVWNSWTQPEHITKWNTASEDWHTPHAENDLRVGGTFSARMEAKDGSTGFDFAGIYTEVVPMKRIAYKLGDERMVEIVFEEEGDHVKITETFDMEHENSAELQKQGWQTIMDNFKKYTESL